MRHCPHFLSIYLWCITPVAWTTQHTDTNKYMYIFHLSSQALICLCTSKMVILFSGRHSVISTSDWSQRQVYSSKPLASSTRPGGHWVTFTRKLWTWLSRRFYYNTDTKILISAFAFTKESDDTWKVKFFSIIWLVICVNVFTLYPIR